jgi:hypothetical protein
VGEAFTNAPTPVRVHFDVGGNYQHNPPNPYVIPASLARGGKVISETLACPDPVNGQLKECAPNQMPGQYPRHPGTVGWKTGFRFLRDELLGFDRNRKDMFRYVLFAHSLGIPVESCLKPDGTSDFVCQDTNPNFHVPVTNSAIGDFPGGDLLVTQEDGTGLIAGIPTTVQVRSFRLRVADAAGQTATQDLCIHIEESHAGTLQAEQQNETMTPEAIAQTLVGEGQAISISNVRYTGATGGLGTFTGGFNAAGLSSGAILSSGAVGNVNPPNTADDTSADNGLAGDSDLQSLIPGFVTQDAAVLEFDFTVTNPAATSVKFDYVFASEEYNEYVYQGFNDVFGFFMSGPNFPKANLALIPNTNTPVTIDNVNGGNPFGVNAHNPTQFINNDLDDGGGQVGTAADGLTKVFSISANITPNVTYHLKLAIGDVGDGFFDSWVMIKAGSFSAVCPIIPTCPTCGSKN